MEVYKLDQIIKMNPFRNMGKIKINEKDNCVLGNRCFVKIDKVRYIPDNCIPTTSSIKIRGHEFTLRELLYSPFHFRQPQYQYLLPSFVLNCIDEAHTYNAISMYCISNNDTKDDSLNINIFIPTKIKCIYLIIGLRIKYFWSSKFEIE
ncbi:SPV027 hypothetical protein [Swinepox virus]|uniref:Uncharacterized protein n=2 Tax=Swinepox virus TaxID=10276 RepID=Q8V3R7_SWPV1|nr:hypothetical protein SWPVgp027 [Swinepox virus]AAL69766.1 SPV027 hypothetical protein [Swinepox virus]QQG31517.1 hypothetical protein [Swinepox virus]UED36652.1 hypothetical protein SPVwb_026 [Swinepox virus]UED36801.1 hypothetical protein SPVdp_028 [Swinepox virus]UUA44217.1 SPV027 [Swinepox virus]